MNCSPVRNGATAEIVNIVCECLKERYEIRSICIDDFIKEHCSGLIDVESVTVENHPELPV